MITTARVKEWSLEKGKRILKVLQFGAKTSKVAAPFGDDANPVKDMTAILAETGVAGETVIIGYINDNQIAEVGEKRIFSLDATGKLSTYIHLKNDETMEIGGNADYAVRFSKLKEGIDAKDLQIVSELTKIQSAITTLGGVYIPGTVNTDIEAAKINTVKVS